MIESRDLWRLLVTCGRAVDALVFPWECAICGAGSEGSPFCGSCREELLHASDGRAVCARCAMPVGPWATVSGGCSECRGQALGFDGAVALGPYQGPIRHLCLMLKRERNAWLGRWLADLLIEARRDALNAPADAWVVPVPLHWRRAWGRGYNQADALAAGVARRLSLCVRRPLRRVVSTPPLALVGRTERARLMHSAFQTRPMPGLPGRTILLVDDILTTGATTGAAARALKRAGAKRVVVVVVGRAEGIA